MPARFHAHAVVRFHISILLGGSERWRFSRIKADRDNFKLVPDIKGDLFERAQHSIQNLRAKHRAVVIDKRQHHGFLAEELSETNFTALLVFEYRVERNLFI